MHTEDEFEIDITDKLKDEIREAMDGTLEIEDIRDVIESTVPKRNITVVEESCIGCAACMGVCPVEAIELEMPSPVHVGEECIYCGKCVETCPFGSIVLKEEYFDAHEDKIFFVRFWQIVLELVGYLHQYFPTFPIFVRGSPLPRPVLWQT